jgi:CsoR family transcriptional regulator, copper-sensing transcriptional repressor
MATEAATTRGYTATKDQLHKRLRRIEGQVRGIQRMVDDDRPCPDILVQIAAIEAALDKVALGLLDGHVKHCVASADPGERERQMADLMEAMGRFMRR